MRQLIQWIEEYRTNPTGKLKDEIFDRLLSLEENGELSGMVLKGEWYRMGTNIRLRRCDVGSYDVTELYKLPNGSCMCYYYKINLQDYSYAKLEEYKNNCREALEEAPDGGFFSAYAVALTYEVNTAEKVFIASNSAEVEKWFGTL